MWSLKLNVAADAYSVWAKVWYRRPFAGGSIGDHAQLSPTPIGDHVQLFRDHAQLQPEPRVRVDHQTTENVRRLTAYFALLEILKAV